MFKSPLAKKQKLRMHDSPEISNESTNSTPYKLQGIHALTVTKLRAMVQSCLATSQEKSAVFYASKLATMTNEFPDLMLLARSFFAIGDHYQAIDILKRLTNQDKKVLRRTGAMENSTYNRRKSIEKVESLNADQYLSAHLLLGQCMMAIKQWEDCQDLLENVLTGHDQHIVSRARVFYQSQCDQPHINVIASLCCLRGEVCEALESRERAAYWYKLALQCDVHCCDAFTHLVEKHMLSSAQEKQLFESLEFIEPEDDYLKCFYASQLGRYDPSPSIPEKFHAIESIHRLQGNIDVLVAKAEAYYYQLDTEKAHAICRGIRENEPSDYKSIPVYVTTMVQLQKKSDLFRFAHQMVDTYPKKAAAWYAVGCYYILINNFEAAQRYFHKATTLEPHFAPAWIGFGNAFAMQDESDQAMSSYRTASRLFLGCHLPLVCLGMEHYRVNNLPSALQFIQQARSVCPTDPLVYNELGAMLYRQQNYPAAIEMFSKTITLCQRMPKSLLVAWEGTFFNMAQAHRKLKQYDRAIQFYEDALALCPTKASTYFALGFTYHLQGDLSRAIQSYHTALSYDPEDPIASQMLDEALHEKYSTTQSYKLNTWEEEPTNEMSMTMDLSCASLDL